MEETAKRRPVWLSTWKTNYMDESRTISQDFECPRKSWECNQSHEIIKKRFLPSLQHAQGHVEVPNLRKSKMITQTCTIIRFRRRGLVTDWRNLLLLRLRGFVCGNWIFLEGGSKKRVMWEWREESVTANRNLAEDSFLPSCSGVGVCVLCVSALL